MDGTFSEDGLALAAQGAPALEAGRAGLLGRLLAADERLLVAARRWHGPWRTWVARGLPRVGAAGLPAADLRGAPAGGTGGASQRLPGCRTSVPRTM